jgi:hypothetical protein
MRLNTLRRAYVALLMSHDWPRADGQDVLCALRDEIADLEGRDAQIVQEDYEDYAATGKLFHSHRLPQFVEPSVATVAKYEITFDNEKPL